MQHDRGVGLACRTDRDPAQVLVPDIQPHLVPENVAVEGERLLGLEMRKKARVNSGLHTRHGSGRIRCALLDS